MSIPQDIDYAILSALLPEANFEAPTPDLVVALYRLVVAQAAESDTVQRELEETKAELQRKDVELDQALQDRESATRELESVSESLQNELQQVKRDKDDIRTSSPSRVPTRSYTIAPQSRQNSPWRLSCLHYRTRNLHLRPSQRL